MVNLVASERALSASLTTSATVSSLEPVGYDQLASTFACTRVRTMAADCNGRDLHPVRALLELTFHTIFRYYHTHSLTHPPVHLGSEGSKVYVIRLASCA